MVHSFLPSVSRSCAAVRRSRTSVDDSEGSARRQFDGPQLQAFVLASPGEDCGRVEAVCCVSIGEPQVAAGPRHVCNAPQQIPAASSGWTFTTPSFQGTRTPLRSRYPRLIFP
jgi:hypothetical protein